MACARLLARGDVDILVNNAASFPAALTVDQEVTSFEKTFDTNVGGVRVDSVAPGPTKTEGVEAEWGETNEELGRALPLGRTAESEEIAHAVLYLASPLASFITGSTLHADGGGTAI